MNWRDDLYKTWVAASITWAVALHLVIAIERPDWAAVLLAAKSIGCSWSCRRSGMALLMLGIVWIITRFPKLPK